MLDNEKNKKDREIFYKNCLKTNNLTPVAFIKKWKEFKKRDQGHCWFGL